MNIQDVIAKLAAIKEEYGNLPVVVYDFDISNRPFEPDIIVQSIGYSSIQVALLAGNQGTPDTHTAFLPENQL